MDDIDDNFADKNLVKLMEKKSKCVTFDPNVKIYHMHTWSFAYHEARKSCDWARIAADRYRFQLRKEKIQAMLDKIGFFCYKP